MKGLNIFYSFMVLASVMLIAACAKDGGFYDPNIVEREFNGDTYEYLKSKPGIYDSLIKVIDRLELEPTLRDSNITLFALTNQSFQLALTNLNIIRELADRPSEDLSSIDFEELDTMASQYMIRGHYLSDSLTSQDGLQLYGVRYGYPMHARVTNATSSGYLGGGPTLIDFSDTKRSQFERNWITTSTGSINVKTNNAVVHVINPDHIFGFEDFVSRLTYIPPPPNLFQIIGGTFSVQRESPGGPNGVEASKYAFDNNVETKYLVNDMGSVWLQFVLNEAAAANAYTIRAANDSETYTERDPIDWNLQASNNGEDWVTLDSRSGEIFAQNFMIKVFRINNTTAYTHYRLNITRVRSGGTLQMADWSVNLEE